MDAPAGSLRSHPQRGERDLTEAEICSLIPGHDALVTGWAAPASGGPPPITPAVMEAADACGSSPTRPAPCAACWTGCGRSTSSRATSACAPQRCRSPTTWPRPRWGLIIMSTKRLMDHALHVRGTGGWRSPAIPVGEQYLTGATVGIVGAGDVGREVIRVLRPFAVRMLVYDPFLTAEPRGCDGGREGVAERPVRPLGHRVPATHRASRRPTTWGRGAAPPVCAMAPCWLTPRGEA